MHISCMSLCDRTNTRRFNRTDYYHFVSPAEQSKDNLFFTDSPAVSLNEVTSQLTECVGSMS